MENKKSILILCLLVLAITAVEMIILDKVSLWHDESFSALLVKYDFSEMMARIKMDVHPPLYYVVLRGWTDVFSNSLFSLRMFSVFLSILAIFSLYLFTNQAFKNRKLALFSSALYALSYFQIQYAMEARMYSLGTFFMIISGYLLLKAIESRRFKWWLWYALSASFGIYTHYFAAFWIVAHILYLIYLLCREFKLKFSNWLNDKNFKFASISYFLVLVSYIPWLPVFFRQFNQVQESYWIPPMDIWSIPNTFSKMTIGGAIDPANGWYILAALMAMVFWAVIVFIGKTPTKEKWLIFALIFLPFLLTAALSYKRSIYIDRYFIFGFPFYLILLAGSILSLNNKLMKKILITAAVLGASLVFPIRWANLRVEEKPGMAEAAKYVNQNARSDEKIFVGSSLIYFTFKYYNRTDIYPKLYAPDSMPHFSGTALLAPKDIIADFDKETNPGDTVWMLNTTGFGNYQPAVPVDWTKIEEKGFQEVQDYQGWIIVAKYGVK